MAQMTVIPATKHTRREKIRVAAYCRVSTNKEDQVHSYEAQVRYFSSLYERSQTEQLIGIYADEGISGTDLTKRAEFNRMIEDCRHGRIDRIVTKSVSRFARNTRDCLKCIRELKSLGISIAFEKENIDTARMSDEMMITVMGGLAQEESQSISNNSRWGIHKKMANGTFRHAKIPYGYAKDDETGGLVVNPGQAEIIKRIFDLYINGTGARKITLMLNDEGIPSPTGIKWNQKTILKILSQEKYTGDTLWQKTYNEFMGIKFRPNEGQLPKYYIEGSHDPIISKETFALAQKMKKQSAPKRFDKNDTPFRKKIVCGCCGHTYAYVPSKRRDYWQCGYRFAIDKPCGNRVFFDDELRIAFTALCDKLYTHKNEILKNCAEQFDELDQLKAGGTLNTENQQMKIVELREQKYRLSQLRTKNFISQEKYDEQINEINIKLDLINKKTAELEESTHSGEAIYDLYTMIEDYDGSEQMRLELLESMIEKITVIDGTFKFSLIGKIELTERIGGYGS